MTLVFDVNETLLDLAALDADFEDMFGDAGVRRGWFSLVLRNALTLTITEDDSDFVAVAAASLEMVADERGVTLPEGARERIGSAMRLLPPHDDVVPGLEMLRDAGMRITALTNSPRATARAQLTNAGIIGYFDEIMTVEGTGRFKPAPEVYRRAAERLQTEPAGLTMVAAHDWDIAGAMSVGYRGAYIVRPGTAINPLYDRPDIIGGDLTEVAGLILEQGGAR